MNRERRAWRVRTLVVATAVSLAAGLSSVGVAAERMPHPEGGWRGHEVERFRGGEPRRGPEIERWRHGDIRHFQEHDLGRWRGGRWLHGDHLGRVGWWWVVDGTWYFYPAPIYPYPDPYIPPSVVAAQSGYWYYCPSVSEYYPYVSDCPGGWTPVLPPPTS